MIRRVMLRCVTPQVKPLEVEDRAELRTPPGRGSAGAAAPDEDLLIMSVWVRAPLGVPDIL